ncbi:Peptidoglycan glycosyltransferase [Alkaliphilus metalliredigens QYMF]|uniref:Peptidoglycan glycosyltransferase n=1 Tax=Alkaliphilus metalliredigens (strain QYMF) TaxID=293826 RepID=A6TS67_ALKMQ|nr:penicillin-binding transpeptidase domain-containing protein [Alkaliphilus metalliredigens]ABR49035.1 Peptidoglycan glycosyltransferase [Alkaliphilus metalliredigens QYMF]
MSQPSISSKRRLVGIFAVVSFVIFGLIIRLGWIQIVNGEKYKELANSQQTRDTPIPATRGTIYDRNGKELAISASTNTIWASPREVQKPEEAAKILAEMLDLEEEKLLEQLLDKTYGLVRVSRWVDDEIADAVRGQRLSGVWIAEDNKRYYPYGNFASYILGHTTNDNNGMAGIELEYDKYLTGLPGRWIKSTDGAGRQLSFGVERYYPPENGLNVVLTIDEVIQHFAEKAVENALEINKAKRVSATVMDIKTGEILAMAIKPDYDPNEPRIPLDHILKAELENMSNEEQLDAWYAMWRNPVINDTYEPGSTFKVITTSAALEEGVATLDSTFYSSGTINVAGTIIRSWRWYNPFGHQTLAEAVQNSDNPVFVELGQRMGPETFYRYINGFGFADVTGVDLPGERKSIMYSLGNVGPVELATISFGQSISVTPIQLLTATAAIANDGKLMKPRIVKELVDLEGNIVHQFEETMVRQVISEKTSKEMLEIMESVVAAGGGGPAYIPGHRVGGKTGTAQKAVDGRYAQGLYVSSFVGVVPIDDPQLAILVIVDEPNGFSHFGSTTAGPVAKEIFEESLRYLDIKPKYTESEAEMYAQTEVIVPEVRDMTVKDAAQILIDNKLQYNTEPEYIQDDQAMVIDMFPKPGARVTDKSIVLLYTQPNEHIPSTVLVPDLRGKTIREANTILRTVGLNLKVTGSGKADNQSPEPGTEVDPGTIVNVVFKPG